MSTHETSAEKRYGGTRQATLTDVLGTDDDVEHVEFEFDEYGPTMNEPVPFKEYRNVPGADGIEYRELSGTGLAPSDYEILSGICHPKTAARNGFHPDDMVDPNAAEVHGAVMAEAAALEALDVTGGER